MQEREAFRKALREKPHLRQFLGKLYEHGQLRSSDTMTDAELEEMALIVCGTEHGGITGSKRSSCVCGETIWVSPSTQVMAAKHRGPASYICMQCLMKFVKESSL